ncbi:MAG: chloride channel protein [Myxococcaceae bacterium]
MSDSSQGLRLKVQQWYRERLAPTERQRLFGLTILIGGVCGLAAVAFHQSIKLLAALTIEKAEHASGWKWVPLTVLVPFIGAALAGSLLQSAPLARGSGIPQVKVAYRKRGVVRFRDAVAKFFIGTVQIGTGSSLGREGPTVQICSGVASGMARLAGLSPQNVRRLMPVGAAAGIAAAFNAPIAAVTFTIEEIVGTLDQTLLSGVIVAAALAAVVERSVLGTHPIFEAPAGLSLESPVSLPLYAGLGVAAGMLSLLFNDLLLGQRKRFREAAGPGWLKPALGSLSTGALAVVGLWLLGAEGVTGGGYTTLSRALTGALPVTVMLGLCALKLFATTTTYASGGAGGIFAPTLFIGGMLGGAFGSLDVQLFDHSSAELGSFALVGMGALFAGVVRAPITSVLIIIEMTNGYSLILPLMIANMSAYAIARRLRPVQIYDALLLQDGISLDEKPADVLEGATVGQLSLDERPWVTFKLSQSSRELLQAFAEAGRQEVFPVLDSADRLAGIITLEDLTTLAASPDLESLVNAADLMRRPASVLLSERATVALERMNSAGVRELPVLDAGQKVIGFVDEAAIARAVLKSRLSPAS